MKEDYAKECDDLMSEASRLLETTMYEKALKVGKKLEKMRFSGAFEVQALAYAGLNKKGKAIKILEKGTKKVPDVWLLWELLGNYYSDEHKFEKANAAFEQGLKTQQPDRISLKYNYANALMRQGKLEQAQHKVSEIISDKDYPGGAEPKLILLIIGLRITLLSKLNRTDEAINVFSEFERNISKYEGEVRVELALIYTAITDIYRKLKNIDKAGYYLKEAVMFHKSNTDAQWLYREMYGSGNYKDAKYFRLLVEGVWHVPFEGETELPGFVSTYDVVANDINDALEIIKYFEPAEVLESLRIKEAKIMKSVKQPRGVYKTTGYVFFTGNSTAVECNGKIGTH